MLNRVRPPQRTGRRSRAAAPRRGRGMFLASLGIMVLAGFAWAAWMRLSPKPPDARQSFAAAEDSAGGSVQLVAVQASLDLESYRDAGAFRRMIERLLDEALAGLDPDLPTLVVFPEDIGLPLVLLGETEVSGNLSGPLDEEGLSKIMAGFVQRHLRSILPVRARYGVGWARAIWISRQETIARTYIETFAAAARRRGVYLAAGSAPLQRLPIRNGAVEAYRVDRPEVYNTAYLFGPDGKVLLTSQKVHLLAIEGANGLDFVPGKADQPGVAATPLGRIGLAICLDAFHEDVLQALTAQGAQVLVQPSANPAAWTEEQQLDWLNGTWRAVAEDGRFEYGVNAMAVGSLYDLRFEGQSSIIQKPPLEEAGSEGSPLGYRDTGPRQGFLAVASTHDGVEVLQVQVPVPDAVADGGVGVR